MDIEDIARELCLMKDERFWSGDKDLDARINLLERILEELILLSLK